MTFLNLFPSFLISRSCFIFLTYPCLKVLHLLSVPFILVILDLFLKTFFLLQFLLPVMEQTKMTRIFKKYIIYFFPGKRYITNIPLHENKQINAVGL